MKRLACRSCLLAPQQCQPPISPLRVIGVGVRPRRGGEATSSRGEWSGFSLRAGLLRVPLMHLTYQPCMSVRYPSPFSGYFGTTHGTTRSGNAMSTWDHDAFGLVRCWYSSTPDSTRPGKAHVGARTNGKDAAGVTKMFVHVPLKGHEGENTMVARAPGPPGDGLLKPLAKGGLPWT